MFNWLQFPFITPPNLLVHLDCWSNEATSKKLKKGFWLIGGFNDCVKEIDESVDSIKVLSWYWSLNRLKVGTFMYHEWCWNPRDCLSR